jgi:hypothetical protein
MDTRDELLGRVLDSAARIKKRGDRLKRTKRDLRIRTANFIETDGGVFEHLLRTATKLSFLCNKSVIQT